MFLLKEIKKIGIVLMKFIINVLKKLILQNQKNLLKKKKY